MNALAGAVRLDTADAARIVQLSDTHLMASAGGTLLGLDTDASLAAVCRLVASLAPIDALLLTGTLRVMRRSQLINDSIRWFQPWVFPVSGCPGTTMRCGPRGMPCLITSSAVFICRTGMF